MRKRNMNCDVTAAGIRGREYVAHISCDTNSCNEKQQTQNSTHSKYQRMKGLKANMFFSYCNIYTVCIILAASQIYNIHSNSFMVFADKDSNWYQYGENPNNKFKMYWKDAQNVLQDLSKFRSLHIKYHGCV
jgi:hypothetical protein